MVTKQSKLIEFGGRESCNCTRKGRSLVGVDQLDNMYWICERCGGYTIPKDKDVDGSDFERNLKEVNKK